MRTRRASRISSVIYGISRQQPVPEHNISVSRRRRRGGECVHLAHPVDRNRYTVRAVLCGGSVTSLLAGVAPAICAVLLSMLLGAYTFVVGARHATVHAFFQSLLFAVDGIVVIHLTFPHEEGAPVIPTRRPADARA